MEGKTARGASSPAKPALQRPEPLSHTRAVVSSSHMVEPVVFGAQGDLGEKLPRGESGVKEQLGERVCPVPPCPALGSEVLESSGMAAPQNPMWAVPRDGLNPVWRCWEGVMLVSHGSCSTLVLLLHPSPAAAQNWYQSLLPTLPRELWCCHARLVPPKSGQGVPGDALLSTSVSAAFCCSDLASAPQNGEKSIALPRRCSLCQRMSSRIQRETGKTLQRPKKQKKKEKTSHSDFCKSTTCFGFSPTLITSSKAPNCGIMPRLAFPQCHANRAGATP